jgi:SPP1 gp7 family putative phage head morphogenesis protein
MSSVMLINLVVFYSFLIIVLCFALYLFVKIRKNRLQIMQNTNPILKILECYSININDFIDFIDSLVSILAMDHKSVNNDNLKYDLLNYFVLFLNGQTDSLAKLSIIHNKHKGRIPLLYIIERNFILSNGEEESRIIYHAINNQFNSFLNFSSQKELGIQFFEWISLANDENVCPFCKSANGKIFSWKEGNNGKFPGRNRCVINGFCRCIAKPVDISKDNIKILKNKDGSYSLVISD